MGVPHDLGGNSGGKSQRAKFLLIAASPDADAGSAGTAVWQLSQSADRTVDATSVGDPQVTFAVSVSSVEQSGLRHTNTPGTSILQPSSPGIVRSWPWRS